MKKNEMKEKYNDLLKEFKLTLVNEDTKEAREIKNKYEHIRYDSIFTAYGKPSSTKVRTYYECKELVEKFAEKVNGKIYNKGIAGAGKDNYNYLAKVVTDTFTTWIYCTKGANRIVIKEV